MSTFVCQVCNNRSFPTKEGYMSHCASNTHLEVARAQATILFCTQCGPGTNFTDTKALEKHKGREHTYPCSKCNLGFPILRLREEHRIKEHPIRCTPHEQGSPGTGVLEEHVNNKHHSDQRELIDKTKDVATSTDQQPLAKSSQCEKHVQTDPPAERKEIAIQSSESSLKIEGGLLDQCQPPKMVASQSKVFCSPCRIFVPVHDLEAHFRVSLNHPSCDSCGMGFENGLSFTKHAFTFHTELCCETCGLAFSGSHLLDQHYADSGIHVTCPVCTHGFKDEILLQEHLQAGCHEDVDLVEPDTFASGLDQITEMKRNDDDEDTPDSIVSSSRSRRSSISSASFITSIERPASALSVATTTRMSVADSSSANSILSVVAAGRQCAGPLERGDSHSRVNMRSISTIPPSPTPTGHEEPIQANRIPSSTSQSIAPSSVTAPENLLTKSKNSFDCRVCGHCPEEPVATMCGHLFCLRCLVQGLASTGRCPACDNVILLRLQV